MKKIQRFFNFNNIGQKIKNFTKWYCWISIILVWISCAIVFLMGFTDDDLFGLCLLSSLIGAIIYPFIVWLSCWFLYAFGELVESNQKICNAVDKTLVPTANNSSASESVPTASPQSLYTAAAAEDDEDFSGNFVVDTSVADSFDA